MSQTRSISSDFLRIDFVPDCGGSISAFKFFNGSDWVNILRDAEPGCIANNNPLDSSCFPLFPFSNRIIRGRFNYEGEEYTLPINMPPEPHAIHGSAWQNVAIATEYTQDYLKIVHNQTSDDYPFKFSAVQKWRIIDERTVEISLSLLNMGDTPMPFGMGIHPYFVKTPNCSITTNTNSVILNDEEMVPDSISKIPQEWDFSKGLKVTSTTMDNCYMGWDKDCLIKWPELNAQVKIKADDIFGNMVVYIPPSDDFFCLEPVTNINDAYNNELELPETGLKVLAPAEKLEGKITFSF